MRRQVSAFLSLAAAGLILGIVTMLALSGKTATRGELQEVMVRDARGNLMLMEDPGFDINEGLCCTAVHWPCCMSKACCDKWEEEKLGEPAPDAAPTAAARFMGGLMPTLVLTGEQVRALEARQGMAMMSPRQRVMRRPIMRQGYYGQVSQEEPTYMVVPIEKRGLKQI